MKRNTVTLVRYRDKKTGRFVSKSAAKKRKRGSVKREKVKRRRKKKVHAKKTKTKLVEYVLHFDYGTTQRRRGANLIRFQVHIIGPEGTADGEVIKIIKHWDATGELPQGWEVRVIFWGHPDYEDEDVEDDFVSELEGLKGQAIQSGSGYVRR